MDSPPALQVLGVRVARLDPAAALSEIERLYEKGTPASVVHVNAHTLNLAAEDPSYRAVLKSAGLVLNDGKGIMLAARLQGYRFPADLNGNFFGPRLLELAASRGWSVFFLGAAPGIAETAARCLSDRIAGLQVVGVRDGHFGREQDAEVAEEIRATGAGLVLVARGNPLQERWLHRWLPATGARLGTGVGAFFDFQASAVQRAPGWMNRLGLEWAHRLVLEPRRMWRRYLVGNPLFLVRAARSARMRSSVPGATP
ncbi:MAG: WecB/TagA/CpsF family glycosyltransferase [Actinomycetota bacterium]